MCSRRPGEKRERRADNTTCGPCSRASTVFRLLITCIHLLAPVPPLFTPPLQNRIPPLRPVGHASQSIKALRPPPPQPKPEISTWASWPSSPRASSVALAARPASGRPTARPAPPRPAGSSGALVWELVGCECAVRSDLFGWRVATGWMVIAACLSLICVLRT